MARLYLAGLLALILLPILFAGAIADLTRKQAVILAVLGVLGGGMIAFYNTEAYSDLLWRWRAPAMPDDERQFVSAVSELRANATGLQDARRLEVLREELCKTPADASDWIGLVANSFNSPSGKKRIVQMKISPHIIVRTAFADDQTDTLIAEGSKLYPVAAGVSPGDPVRFSGRFVSDAGSCSKSENPEEALEEPNFVLRFSDMRKLQEQ
jgi:hypothetical protein